MRWYEKPGVLDYVIECYAGTDKNERGHQKRQFIWEDLRSKDVVIGNSRAFTDHVSEKFNLGLTSTDWSALHEAMRMLGEVVHQKAPRTQVRGKKFHNQQPEVRVIRRRT
jgi:hypothetical protein